MSKFQIGDRVIINPKLDLTESNKQGEGMIKFIRDDDFTYKYEVHWTRGVAYYSDKEIVMSQSYLNELKLKKVLGL